MMWIWMMVKFQTEFLVKYPILGNSFLNFEVFDVACNVKLFEIGWIEAIWIKEAAAIVLLCDGVGFQLDSPRFDCFTIWIVFLKIFKNFL